jgi:hypothetical protein
VLTLRVDVTVILVKGTDVDSDLASLATERIDDTCDVVAHLGALA